jgi:hypothetical protein
MRSHFSSPSASKRPVGRLAVLATAIALGITAVPQTANTQSAPANLSTIWWVPAESGWGLNLNEQGGKMFGAWFTYADDGKALWLYVPEFKRQTDGSWQGEIYRTTGVPFDKITGMATTSVNSQGTAVLTPNADGTITFRYTLGTVVQEKRMERFVFNTIRAECSSTTASRATATNYQDIWFNEAEPGWGINLIHQGNTIFAAWYTYRQDGTAQWLTANAVSTNGSSPPFTGALTRFAGKPLAQINGAPATTGPAQEVGTVQFSFTDGETGTMSYTLDGVTQMKPIRRFVFGSPATVCVSVAVDPPPASAAPPTEPGALNAWLQAGKYKTWAAEAAIHPARSPHPTNVRSFANAPLETAMRAGNTTFPIDSATVKELYSAANQLTGWAVSVKTQAASAGGQGWYWYEVLSTTPGAAPVASGNGLGGCANCHSSGTDFVRTRFPFQQ